MIDFTKPVIGPKPDGGYDVWVTSLNSYYETIVEDIYGIAPQVWAEFSAWLAAGGQPTPYVAPTAPVLTAQQQAQMDMVNSLYDALDAVIQWIQAQPQTASAAASDSAAVLADGAPVAPDPMTEFDQAYKIWKAATS